MCQRCVYNLFQLTRSSKTNALLQCFQRSSSVYISEESDSWLGVSNAAFRGTSWGSFQMLLTCRPAAPEGGL